MTNTEQVQFKFYVEDADGYSEVYSQIVTVSDDEELYEARDRAFEIVQRRALEQARYAFDINAQPFIPVWDTVEDMDIVSL